MIIEDGNKTLMLGGGNTSGEGLFYDCPLETLYLGRNLSFGGSYDSPFAQAPITNLTISKTVTSIHSSTFYECKNLTSVTIPNSVTSIGDMAFFFCDNLKAIHISDLSAWCKIDFESRSSNPLYYAHNLYLNGELITDLTIPDDITEINDYAFCANSDLTSVTIPSNITSIGYSSFEGCNSLKKVILENGQEVLNTKSGVFKDCPIETVYLGRTLNSSMFANSSITNLTISNNVTSIGDSSFYGCTGLTSVEISNSVTSIGDSSFYGCTGLTSVEIPNSVTSIGNYAFSECSNIKELVIEDGEKILELGDNGYDGLFYDCPLETVYLGRNLNYDDSYDGGYSPFYKTAIASLTISDSVTTIGNYAFSGCSGLTSVTIPNSVTTIGNYAFSGCSGLTSVTIPESVTSIGGSAFSGCSGLTSVTIPESVTSIGNYAFSGCSGLTSVTIPNSVTTIGGSAFKNCSDLASITIPNSITTIGNSAFGGCNLSHISFEYNKDIYVGTLAEDNPNAISDLYVPNDVIWFSNENPYSNFNYNLYFDNDLVTEYTFPKDALEIQSNVFKGCISIKNITVPDNIIIIGSAAFKDSGLESLILGRKVTKIEEDAFNCNSLMKINSLNTYYPIIKMSSFSDYSYQNAIVNVPMESLKDYKESEWGNFQNLNGKAFGNIEYITSGEVNVTVSGRNIIVDGADDLLKRVYNLSGLLIYSGMDDTIPISTSGIYLINIADKTYKLTIK